MTYREKLKLEHPDKVGGFLGGCKGCPDNYGWENVTKECVDHPGQPFPEVCTKCWDREIPEKIIGYIEFRSGRKLAIVRQALQEDSTDCLVVYFQLKTGPWLMFKKNRQSGEAHFYLYGSLNKHWYLDRTAIEAVVKENGMTFLYKSQEPMVKDEESLYPKIPISKELEQYIKYDTGMVVKALTRVRQEWEAKLNAEKKRNKLPQIKNVIFNNPATIVFWDDGSKTVVKANGDDPFDPEKGLAMAISKKALGNSSSYFDEFKKWCKDEPKVENKKTELQIYRESLMKSYISTASGILTQILRKASTRSIDEDVINEISELQIYLSQILNFLRNTEPTTSGEFVSYKYLDTLHVKFQEARVALENVAFYTNKPLKKDLENAIDKALDALMDISEMYPKEG